MLLTDPAADDRVNGIDRESARRFFAQVQAKPGPSTTGFRVETEWKGKVRTETTVGGFALDGQPIARNFTIVTDEPVPLPGAGDTGPCPEELMLSAVTSCMIVTFVMHATIRGIPVSDCRIVADAEIDLRGFCGFDASVPAGFEQIDFEVRVDGPGTRGQYEEIFEAVLACCPNYSSLKRPIRMTGRLA